VFGQEALDCLVHRRPLVLLCGDDRHRSHLGDEASEFLRGLALAAGSDRPVHAVGFPVIIRDRPDGQLPHAGAHLLE
jgi:hypothetical protein